MKMSEKVESLISKLDGASGRLIVTAMKSPLVREAMEMVSEVSIELGYVAEELESEGK